LRLSDICIDVGANIGLYTCLAASRRKKTVSVEPASSNLPFLYRNLIQNGFQSEVFPVGLGQTPELKKLYGAGTGASFIEHWADTPTSWNHVVPVTTLDVIAGTRFTGQRLLIKIDVEGFEYSVLQGASVTLALQPHPVWLLEICFDQNFPGHINPDFAQVFELFWNAGYSAHTADRAQRLVTASDVSKWISSGHIEFGTHNYLFTSTT
jgi:FkbM family methyltransferase